MQLAAPHHSLWTTPIFRLAASRLLSAEWQPPLQYSSAAVGTPGGDGRVGVSNNEIQNPDHHDCDLVDDLGVPWLGPGGYFHRDQHPRCWCWLAETGNVRAAFHVNKALDIRRLTVKSENLTLVSSQSTENLYYGVIYGGL